MEDNLRKDIEKFIIDYENQIYDLNNIDMATTDELPLLIFLETSVNLLNKCLDT
jgi:hypothetical protein|tara:strand:- start:338 stop:499 length:162 start_codon:yes stop_codon:yes gene_type:complete